MRANQQSTLDLVGHWLFISPHSLALLHLRTCSFLSLFYFILSIAPTFCCVLSSVAHFRAWLFYLRRVFFQNTHNVLLPRLARFNWPQPPDYAADTHRERLLLGHRPKTLLHYPFVSSLTSHTHSLPTSTNILAGHIQHIQLDRDSYPGLEPPKA